MLFYDSVGCQEVCKNHNNLTKVQAAEAVESFLWLAKDNVRDKNPRPGRNPQTGESLDLDARRIITVHPSGILRNKVNGVLFLNFRCPKFRVGYAN